MAKNNRSLLLSEDERCELRKGLVSLDAPASICELRSRVIHQDFFDCVAHLPAESVDLLIVDPPYNLTKTFGGNIFRRMDEDAYEAFTAAWLEPLLPTLKPNASVYICADWVCSSAVHRVAHRYLKVQNRITWQREKGRGALRNWKNASEDVWFCTMGKEYYFDVESVKLKRKVIAPYREKGKAKDWVQEDGGKFRLTHPSNLWTDITVPFWSMPENTEHPTQKSEKFMAKLILASCPEGGLVLDPFSGACSSAVAACKLGRDFIAIEQEETYACLGAKRLALANKGDEIQGYDEGVFWERNRHLQ
ncbi:MAG: site-specific DNA-methyltransferase (adenine-specific) [Rhodothermales bacterium]|jgi:site-specific DNA-methyltransferase (adenine-specific)